MLILDKTKLPFKVERKINKTHDIRVYVSEIPKEGLNVPEVIKLIQKLELAIS